MDSEWIYSAIQQKLFGFWFGLWKIESNSSIKYDSDNFSITDMTEADCRAVNCSEIDLSTCRPFPYESYSNESEEYLAEDQINLYDEDGCFYTDMLRSTRRYETYMNFSLCMGILTIGKSLLSTLNISRSTLKYF